jgi:hypothetical protein
MKTVTGENRVLARFLLWREIREPVPDGSTFLFRSATYEAVLSYPDVPWKKSESERRFVSLTRNCGLPDQAASGKNSSMILYPLLP